MKGMKGRFLQKLKSIPRLSTLKQGLIHQSNPSDNFPKHNLQAPQIYQEQEQKNHHHHFQELLPGSIGISKFAEVLEDEEEEPSFHASDKGKLTARTRSNKPKLPMDNSEVSILSESESDDLQVVPLPEVDVLAGSRTYSSQFDPLLEINVSSFQRAELNSGSLFNPRVLPTIDRTVAEHSTNSEANDNSEEYQSLLNFEAKCPPGGSNSIILYTTSLRGIRKTFQDCNTIRFLLESFRVLFQERDVSMHLEYREELWRIMGGRVVPPRLFIKGRYIGGVDEVVGLHEQGKLRKLLQGIPLDQYNRPCNGCGNMRFMLCFNCNGSRKVITEGENDELFTRCSHCNENGLVKCPMCC